MASYTFLWTGPTWERRKEEARAGIYPQIDYVAGDDKRPFSEVQDGDEIFIVNLKDGRLRLGGRLVADGGPVSETVAEKRLGSGRLIGKRLYVFGKIEALDDFRPGTYLDQSTALALELIDVNGASKNPTRDKEVAGAIYRQEFRQPMRLTENGAATLRACLGLRKMAATAAASVGSRVDNPPLIGDLTGGTLEELVERMSANAETGRIGETIALVAERGRVSAHGCPDPLMAVRHIAPERVDAGYDIESNWNGERRCIEVKSSTTDTPDFFISENERRKLKALGSQAWLYRVIVRDGGSGEVVEMLPDPISQIPEECFKPVVWRVRRNTGLTP